MPSASSRRASSRFSRARFKDTSGKTPSDRFLPRFTRLAIGASAVAILEPPPLVAGSSDQQVQPFLVVELPILLARLRFFDLDIGQRHWGNSPRRRLVV